jgi:hypothetical protein
MCEKRGVVRSINLIWKQTFNSFVLVYWSGPFLRIFPWGGGFFEKGPFCEIIHWRGIGMAEGNLCGKYTMHELGLFLKFEARKYHFLHSEHLNLL